MAAADLSETLAALGDGSDESAQLEAACLLRELVEAEHRVLSNEQFVKFMNEVYEGIFSLVSSASDSRRVRGGVLAIRELIEISYEENEVKVIRFANYIRIVFQQPPERVDVQTLVLAALALGALARAGGPLTVDFVEFEAKRAFEWLLAASELDDAAAVAVAAASKSDATARLALLGPLPTPRRNQFRRTTSKRTGSPALLRRRKLAAVLVLRELALNSPGVFMSHVSAVLEHIRTCLHDDSELTRGAAMLTLRSTLELILQRESRLCVQWYYRVFEIARLGFSQGSPATIHGSLLTLGELLNHSGHFMLPRFAEACETILEYRNHKRDALIRRTVIRLLPELANYCPDEFVRSYLDTCIQHLFSAVEKKTERDAAFLALGKLANAVTFHILPHLPEIMLRVREGLAPDAFGAPKSARDSSRQVSTINTASAKSEAAARAALGLDQATSLETPSHYEAALACISMLAQAVGPALLEHNMTNGLLGEMFRNGLSLALINAVADLQRRIPSLRGLIMSHLLHSLSYTLAGRPFRAPPGGGVLNCVSFTHLDMLEALEVRIPGARPLLAREGPVAQAVALSPSTLGEDDELERLNWPEELTPAEASMHSASFFLYFAGGVQRREAGSNAPPSLAANVSKRKKNYTSLFENNFAESTTAFIGGSVRSLRQRELILLALQTLRQFDFNKINLLPFLHDSVIPYMDDSDPLIRKEVALTCGALLIPTYPGFEATSRLANWGVSAKLTSEGVRRLLMLGVSDPEPAIRAAVLTCLKENDRFDNFLMHEDTLQALFVALHDEDFYVRRIGMDVASRLSPRNPAHIFPAVRKCILASMAQLRFSPTQTQREEGAVILLGDVVAGFNRSRLMKGGISHATPLISPIIVPLIKILLGKLREARNTMSTAILRTLGEVASMHGVDMQDYMADLLPLLIDLLQDLGSPEKRKWALWTLGQLVRSTGHVITPLLDYPELLDTLLGIIKGGSTVPWELREEALKALGSLGALDPFETKQRSRSRSRQLKMSRGGGALQRAAIAETVDTASTMSSHATTQNQYYQQQHHHQQHQQQQQNAATHWPHLDDDAEPLGPKDDDYYPTVAIHALIRILQDSTLATHHSMVIQALTHIFRSLGLACVTFLSQIMPCILQVATNCEQELRKVLFYNISVLVSISKQHIRPYLDDIFRLIHTYWYENLDQVFVLIEEISGALREEFVPYAKSILPNILSVLEMMRTNNMDPSKVSTGASGKVAYGMQGGYGSLSLRAPERRLNRDAYASELNGGGASLRNGAPVLSYASSITAGQMGARRSPRGPALDGVTAGGMSPSASMANLTVPAIGGPMGGVSAVGGNQSSRPHSGSPFAAPSRSAPQGNAHRVQATAEQKLSMDKYATPASARRVFKTIEFLGFTLTGYFYLVIPALIELVETEAADGQVRIYAVHALGHLSSHAFFADYALHAMQCLLRLLRRPVVPPLKCQAVDTLCIFALRFPSIFSMFEQTVENTVRGRSLLPVAVDHFKTTLGFLRAEAAESGRGYSNETGDSHSFARDRYLEQLLKSFYGEASSTDPSLPMLGLGSRNGGGLGGLAGLGSPDADIGAPQKMLQVNENKLQKSWEASDRASAEEWKEWMRRLSVELLRESPSPALRACSAVAQVYNPLAKELFNPAFVSCWSSLSEEYQMSLILALEVALQSSRTPPETLQTLLDLAEFMEHDDRVLPIGIRDLGNYAQRCHAYAKALHYQEMVFRNLPGACTEGLISINNKLEQPEAAVGILHYVQQLQRRQYQMTFSQPASRRIPEVNMLDFGVAAAALSPLQSQVHQQQQQQQQQQQLQMQMLQRQQQQLQMQQRQQQHVSPDSQGSGYPLERHPSVAFEEHQGEVLGASPSSDHLEMDDLVEQGTIKLKETWFEKLGRWEEALESYQEKLEHLEEDPNAPVSNEDLNSTMGKVRCLINLGEYDQLMDLANNIWKRVENKEALATMAPMFCQSAWSCGDWNAMDNYARYIPEKNLDGYMLRAVLALQQNDFVRSREMIDLGRGLLGEELGALVGESYNRAYRQIVTVQQFAELDEIYEFKQRMTSPQHSEDELAEMKSKLQRIWSKRIRGCQENVAVWQFILGAHSLVLHPREDLLTYIKFSTICRKSNRLRICFMTLQRLGVTNENFDDFDRIDANTSFAFLKYRWALLKEETIQSHQEDQLRNSHYMVTGYNSSYRTSFTVVPVEQPSIGLDLSPRSQTEHNNLRVREERSKTIENLEHVIGLLENRHRASPLIFDDCKLLVRCYLKLGMWKLAIEDYKLRQDIIESVLRIFRAATEMEGDNYKAWHAWALMNFRAVEFYNRALLTLSPGSSEHMSTAASFVDLASAHDAIQEETDSILLEEDEEEEEEEEDGEEVDTLPAIPPLHRASGDRPRSSSVGNVGMRSPSTGFDSLASSGQEESHLDEYKAGSGQEEDSPVDEDEEVEEQEDEETVDENDASHTENSSEIQEEQEDQEKHEEHEEADGDDGNEDLQDQGQENGTSEVDEGEANAHSTNDQGALSKADDQSENSHKTETINEHCDQDEGKEEHPDNNNHDENHAPEGEPHELHVESTSQIEGEVLDEKTQSQEEFREGEDQGDNTRNRIEDNRPESLEIQREESRRSVTFEPTDRQTQLREAKARSAQARKARQRKKRLRQRALERKRQLLSEKMHQYVVPAIHGFFRSIALGQTSDSRNVLQDILRLLTLWFAHGARRDVEIAIQEGFEMVSIGTWLDVVPQLIARIHTKVPSIKKALHHLLVTLGEQHPHALVYPLTVAAKSINPSRQRAAENILDELRRTPGNAALVDQAQLVSHELIRVAILWPEQWFEAIEEASRAYFNDEDLDAMNEILDARHATLREPFETIHEHEFSRNYGRELEDAERYKERFRTSNSEVDLNQAWELYYLVFRKIQRDLQSLKHLELDKVSQALLEAHDMQLAVPGTYVAGKPVVRIDSFAPSIRVIVSKQRPRQITMRGSDGKDYLFLLKGHEDLRQDERVMQLFGLVNRLLKKERETNRYDLSIERFAVIPLSHNVGISEWLPNTDTFHALIERFRNSRSVLLDIEQRLIKKVAPDYNSLTVIQKVEAFCHALTHTNGGDLGKVLWLKSRNSEIWLDRRTNYTRSLATMSMVGYVLGLGDRHPSNLMLDRSSGKVIHIDFGDCFEVAMHREKFPEKVPFRLTRMLIAAMEVSGVEGNFRYTCESVMRVLRANRDSVMAMLEAFVHDPLINWRLLQNTSGSNGGENSSSIMSMSSASTGQSDLTREGESATSSEMSRSYQRDMTDSLGSSIIRGPVPSRGEDPSFNDRREPVRRRNPSVAMPIGDRHFDADMALRPRARTEGRINLHESTQEVGSATPSRSRTSRESNLAQFRADANAEALNQRALAVLQRVHDKLTGRDFAVKKRRQSSVDEIRSPEDLSGSMSQQQQQQQSQQSVRSSPRTGSSSNLFSEQHDSEEDMEESPAPVALQVQRLIVQATSHENLSQAYSGWCSVW